MTNVERPDRPDATPAGNQATRPADGGAAPGAAPWNPLDDHGSSVLHALRPRRDHRVGLVQALYIALGVALGVWLPTIHVGPAVAPDTISPLVLGIAGGFISFIALVFSLLFLVVQYGNTTISPRLTLFRDAPIVWHAFGFFLAVFAYATIAAIQLGTRDQDVTILVPGLAITLVLVALLLSRTLQMRALRQLQIPATAEEVRRLGAAVIEHVYRRPFATDALDDPPLPPVRATVRWERPPTTVQQIDVPALLAEARRLDAILDVHVTIGGELARRQPVVTVHAAHAVGAVRALRTLTTGVDRRFAQDPLLAFRVLSDIGNRTLGAAVNDPATAVQALAGVQDLLMLLVDRQLDPGLIHDQDGHPRLRLRLPSWEQYLRAGVDEIAHYAHGDPLVRDRVRALLEALREQAPDERRPAIDRRLERLRAAGRAGS